MPDTETVEELPTLYQLRLDDGDVVVTAYATNLPQDDAVDCTKAIYEEAASAIGRRRFVDGELIAYAPPAGPEPVPLSISDRQFFQQLAIEGVITEAEALATSDGTLPALLDSIIDQLPEGERFGARMKAKNATIYERNDPLTLTVAYVLNQMGSLGTWDAARLDAFWRDASKL